MKRAQPLILLTEEDITFVRKHVLESYDRSMGSSVGLRRLYGVLLWWERYPVITIHTQQPTQIPALRAEQV